jgi:hypothetical protein
LLWTDPPASFDCLIRAEGAFAGSKQAAATDFGATEATEATLAAPLLLSLSKASLDAAGFGSEAAGIALLFRRVGFLRQNEAVLSGLLLLEPVACAACMMASTRAAALGELSSRTPSELKRDEGEELLDL